MARFATIVALGILGNVLATTAQTCPNGCSGHGICDAPDLRCKCFDTWTGGDCSLRTCPYGVAWADVATAVDTAHAPAECSNRGICQRQTGKCECEINFYGASCDKLSCSAGCSGHGVCKSMKHYASSKDKGLLGVGESLPVYSEPWDSEIIHGCECDLGYTGFDCSKRTCHTGDDPLTTGDVDEVQLFQCTATAGEFTLSFKDATTVPIPVDATAVDVSNALNALPTLGQVNVAFHETGATVCDGLPQIVYVTFRQNFGDIPRLYSRSTHTAVCGSGNSALNTYDLCGNSAIEFAAKGSSLNDKVPTAVTSVTGTKENLPCSGRGYCNAITGVCSCYPGYATSDGIGGVGIRGDCGRFLSEITRCPGEVACSGHGYCDSTGGAFQCVCSTGWTSGDCSVRTCPMGKAFFDYPIADNEAHQLAECSNMGLCDEVTGECSCRFGFEGGACEYSTCPGNIPCSGHGRCLAMDLLAQEARPNGVHVPLSYGTVTPNDPLHWDFDSIQGCLCDEGYAGHDCSLQLCPSGDDPDTSSLSLVPQDDELQVLECKADGGSFIIKFREAQTALLDFSIEDTDLKAAIEGLTTIHGSVDVTYSTGATSPFCTSDLSNSVTVTFLGNFGDLPDLQILTATDSADLSFSGSGDAEVIVYSDGTLSVAGSILSVMGTKEDDQCSNRGMCNEVFGVCECFMGYGSSNGRNEKGERGDCGWKMDYYSIDA